MVRNCTCGMTDGMIGMGGIEMTRKKFWGLRNALTVKLYAWAKENGLPYSGISDRAMRPVSGKPLVNFEFGAKYGFGTSYEECWNSKCMKDLRKNLGMD